LVAALGACSGHSGQEGQQLDIGSPPAYRAGDSLTFVEDGRTTTFTVAAVNGDEISWMNGSGEGFVTFRDPTIPPRSIAARSGAIMLSRSFEPKHPTVFPLVVGKHVRYVATIRTSDGAERREQNDCEVRAPTPLTVSAGSFTAWEIACQRGSTFETLFYAPKIGAVILSKSETGAAAHSLTLADYRKGGEPALISSGSAPQSTGAAANGAEASPAPSIGLGLASPAAAGKAPGIAAPAQAPADAAVASTGQYVVQLASFRSYDEASKGWDTLDARVRSILDGLRPVIDEFTAGNGTRFVRLSVGPFAQGARARELCGRLRGVGRDCWVRTAP
jgi:cell division septation protein DedD